MDVSHKRREPEAKRDPMSNFQNVILTDDELQPWRTQVMIDNHHLNLGNWVTCEQAGKASDLCCLYLSSQFTGGRSLQCWRLNFPSEAFKSALISLKGVFLDSVDLRPAKCMCTHSSVTSTRLCRGCKVTSK